MDKTLIEQAREYIANTLRDVPMNYNEDELTFYATFASDFAAKIRDEAVAAEQALERQFICVKCGLRQELGQKTEVNF